MRLLQYVIVGLLVGCSRAPNAGSGGDGGSSQEDADSSINLAEQAPDRSRVGCGELEERIVITTIDGEEVDVYIPVACNRFYLDQGDPPPDDGDDIDDEMNVGDPAAPAEKAPAEHGVTER